MDSLIENSFYKHLIYELKYLAESLNITTPDYPLLTGDEIFSIDNYLQFSYSFIFYSHFYL